MSTPSFCVFPIQDDSCQAELAHNSSAFCPEHDKMTRRAYNAYKLKNAVALEPIPCMQALHDASFQHLENVQKKLMRKHAALVDCVEQRMDFQVKYVALPYRDYGHNAYIKALQGYAKDCEILLQHIYTLKHKYTKTQKYNVHHSPRPPVKSNVKQHHSTPTVPTPSKSEEDSLDSYLNDVSRQSDLVLGRYSNILSVLAGLVSDYIDSEVDLQACENAKHAVVSISQCIKLLFLEYCVTHIPMKRSVKLNLQNVLTKYIHTQCSSFDKVTNALHVCAKKGILTVDDLEGLWKTLTDPAFSDMLKSFPVDVLNRFLQYKPIKLRRSVAVTTCQVTGCEFDHGADTGTNFGVRCGFRGKYCEMHKLLAGVLNRRNLALLTSEDHSQRSMSTYIKQLSRENCIAKVRLNKLNQGCVSLGIKLEHNTNLERRLYG